jgi:arylsulfatase A-like enzyme
MPLRMPLWMAIAGLWACVPGVPTEDPAPGDPALGDPAPVVRAPDVLLVVVDTLRADALGAYGATRPVSNQLDGIAAAGVLFEDVVAPSVWTYPSHASLFTGLYPWEHGARAALQGKPGEVTPLRSTVPTLAESFADAGYDTVSLSANCWLSPELGLVRGFARAECDADDAEILARSRAVLAAPRDRPLFLFVNLLTVHAPYLVQDRVPFSARHTATLAPEHAPDWAAPFLDPAHGTGLHFQRAWPGDPGLTGEQAYTLGRFDIPADGLAVVRDLYDGGVAGADAGLQALVEAWNAGGHGRGIMAVTSDHGEALGDGHRLGHFGRFGQDVLGVPLVVVYPGQIVPGTRVSGAVSLRRVGDTLRALAAVPGPHPQSLVPAMQGAPVTEQPRAALWLHPHYETPASPAGLSVALREGRLTVVVQAHGDAQEQRVAVYDHVSDPGFVVDLAGSHPARLDDWRAEAAAIAASVAPEAASSVMDPAVRAALETLGYLAPAAP